MSLDVAFSMFSFLRTASKVKQSANRSVVSDSLQPRGLYSLWNSPGQNTGVCSFSLLEGIFPAQGSNSGLPHCRQILYQLSHKGQPKPQYLFQDVQQTSPLTLTPVNTKVPLPCVPTARVSVLYKDNKQWMMVNSLALESDRFRASPCSLTLGKLLTLRAQKKLDAEASQKSQ